MSEPFLLKMPVKGYVRKYLEKHVQLPLKVTLNNSLGVFTYHLLRNQESHSQYDKIVSSYKTYIYMSVSERFLFDRGCVHVTSLTIINFNTFIEHEMKRELFNYVMLRHHAFGTDKKKCILQYMAENNISEDDISFEGLRGSIRRMNEKKGKLIPMLWRNENQPHELPRDLNRKNKRA
jgi:hypothetical protein